MKKISKEEAIEMVGEIRSVRKKSNIVEESSKLKEGEYLFIGFDEWGGWGYKSEPYNVVGVGCYNPRSLLFGHKIRVRKGKTGYVIAKIKVPEIQ